MDRFQELQAFVAVAAAGGFAKAAAALNSSPPAITRTVAALEDRLGVRLFDRTTRSVHLTEPGVRFLEDAKRVLSDLNTAEQDLKGDARLVTGQLSLTSSRALGRAVLQSIIADFSDANPLVSVSMILLDRVVDLVDEGFDLAVRSAHLPDSSLVAKHVGDIRRVLVASPEYLAKRGTPQSPADLKTHSIIAQTALMPNREWHYSASGKPARMTLQPRIELNDVHTGCILAEQGKGITIAPSYLVADALLKTRLVTVLADYLPPAIPVHLVYGQRRIVAPKVRAFIDFAAPRLRTALADVATIQAGSGNSRRTFQKKSDS